MLHSCSVVIVQTEGDVMLTARDGVRDDTRRDQADLRLPIFSKIHIIPSIFTHSSKVRKACLVLLTRTSILEPYKRSNSNLRTYVFPRSWCRCICRNTAMQRGVNLSRHCALIETTPCPSLRVRVTTPPLPPKREDQWSYDYGYA